VRLHYSEQNLGFGRACNLAVTLASAPRVVLLNPDAVVRPGCIDALVDALDRHPGAGIVGGRTVRPDGSLEPSSCWGRPTLWSLFCFATGLSTAMRGSAVFDPESMGGWARDTERRVDIVTGCLLAIDRSTWDLLGGFDERFFMYGEDADLSLRAHKMGFLPRITPQAVAVHAVGASSDRKAQKNRLLMTGKATLARTLWSGAGLRVALVLLEIGVIMRATGERLMRVQSPAWRPLQADRAWTRGW
jgi:GT2 family glycosyltransferase